MDGKPFALRDMCVPFPDPCDQHLMRGQQCMDFSPIPRWGDDYPMYLGPRDVKRDEELIEHKVYCIMRVINDIERIFGVKFNDDRLFEAHQSRSKVRDYGREISLAMTNIPSPLGQKDLYSFYTLGGLTKLGPEETENFWKELRDEVMWRVENKIAAVGNERYRWMEAHPSPWHFLKYYRYMEKYGAVCIGSQYSQMIGGPMELRPDGTFGPREMPPAPNKPVRTREDLIRSSIREARGQHMKADEYMRPYALNEFAVGYKVNGALLPLWRGGVGCTLTRKEQGLRLSEIGVSVLHYEGSQPGDRTDLDERNFLDRLDVWMESQGLRMLED
jgi:benzoyl-CoA reductase subunit B